MIHPFRFNPSSHFAPISWQPDRQGGMGKCSHRHEAHPAGRTEDSTEGLPLTPTARMNQREIRVERVGLGSRQPVSLHLDQLGLTLLPNVVTCRSPFPSRPMRNICIFPLRVDVNAIWRPFGENTGLSLLPSP
jgi:hypothetical protein